MRWLLAAVLLTLGLSAPAQAAGSSCRLDVVNPEQCSHMRNVGHRMRGGLNENTRLALERVRDVGASFEADAWVLSDGTAVVFHDKYPCRVVDPLTLPEGVTCKTPMVDLVRSQYNQMLTRGGQPLLRLQELLRLSGKWHVRGMIENKYQQLNAPGVAAMVEHYHSPVTFYQTPKRGGPDHHILQPELADYGIRVGVKDLGAADPTPLEMANANFSFIITGADKITPEYVDEVHSYGLRIGNYDSGKRSVWIHLVEVGADFILNPKPGKTMKWLNGAS